MTMLLPTCSCCFCVFSGADLLFLLVGVVDMLCKKKRKQRGDDDDLLVLFFEVFQVRTFCFCLLVWSTRRARRRVSDGGDDDDIVANLLVLFLCFFRRRHLVCGCWRGRTPGRRRVIIMTVIRPEIHRKSRLPS